MEHVEMVIDTPSKPADQKPFEKERTILKEKKSKIKEQEDDVLSEDKYLNPDTLIFHIF